jgi:MinD-like ATPase involved in chromosome partitioning or flagellar assembly
VSQHQQWQADWPVEPDEEPVPLDLLGRRDAPDGRPGTSAPPPVDRRPPPVPPAPPPVDRRVPPAPPAPTAPPARPASTARGKPPPLPKAPPLPAPRAAPPRPPVTPPGPPARALRTPPAPERNDRAALGARANGSLAQPQAGPPSYSAADFTVERMMRLRRRAPQRGWQRWLYRATGGRLNPGPSTAELHEQELVGRIGRPLNGCWRVSSVAIKGGVGKSTTSVMLGHVVASMRGDRVVALDANPDAGTLGYRIKRQTSKTVKDLLTDADKLKRFADVRAYTSQAPSRLEVIASDNDPRVSEAFDDGDYREVSSILERYYSVIITDCGTGILHSTMRGILDLADQLIVVTAPSLDGGRSAALTLDWLDQHERRDLVENAVVVINSIRPKGLIDLAELEAHFRRRCREVIRVPFDPHLEAGAETSLEELMPDTREAYMELAAAVADGFRA